MFPQLIPEISSLSWFTTIVPLVMVLVITAVKDATDDYVSYFILTLESVTSMLRSNHCHESCMKGYLESVTQRDSPEQALKTIKQYCQGLPW